MADNQDCTELRSSSRKTIFDFAPEFRSFACVLPIEFTLCVIFVFAFTRVSALSALNKAVKSAFANLSFYSSRQEETLSPASASKSEYAADSIVRMLVSLANSVTKFKVSTKHD